VFARGAILLINFFELERKLQKIKIETKWDSKIVVKLSSNTTGYCLAVVAPPPPKLKEDPPPLPDLPGSISASKR
jgi:hypothetical protein